MIIPLRRLRLRRKLFFNKLVVFVGGILFIYFYCEYLIYYVTQVQCGWPELTEEPAPGLEPLYALVLADTHLLGSRRGHWLDKWRREWQMQRAFQAALTLHRPEAVFVLGDLFDEGDICSDQEFADYVERFQRLFRVPEETDLYVAAGNHDIGFHYRIVNHVNKRFEKQLDAAPVQLVTLKGNHFVLVNSMAMEGDGCNLCRRAELQIRNISDIFKCTQDSPLCKGQLSLDYYSKPILMQHFPLYRQSDSMCTGPDAAPLPERNKKFRERKDCLSKESTEMLLEALSPRAVFDAHTHDSCVIRHSYGTNKDFKIEFTEYTVPSFSWRNRLDPKYYLLTISPTEVRVSKCAMPTEWTLLATAAVMLTLLGLGIRYINVAPHRSLYLKKNINAERRSSVSNSCDKKLP